MSKIAVIVGSIRRDSVNRKLAEALAKLAKPKAELTFLKIDDLPLFSQDLEPSPPASVTRLKGEIEAADGVLIVTPEYNRSIPGVLKNAIDIGSRPYGKSVWEKKPAAVISVSPGAIGGFGANHSVRQTLVFLDMPVLQMPEVYVAGVTKLLDERGGIANEATRELLAKFAAAFAAWIERNAAK